LVSIPGIAQVSAMQLLAELSTLPPDLTLREWSHVAALILLMKYRKLSEDGVSHQPRGKSPFEKSALHAALAASRCDPHAKVFFESLLARWSL
jgi:transposase